VFINKNIISEEDPTRVLNNNTAIIEDFRDMSRDCCKIYIGLEGWFYYK